MAVEAVAVVAVAAVAAVTAVGAVISAAMVAGATDMIETLDHIQLAMPSGAEKPMKAFYCALLGMTELPKPAPLQGRGGFWAMAGDMQVHFGIDPQFTPATKAHPAFTTHQLSDLADRLQTGGHAVRWDTDLPQVTRFFTHDPVGNRIEFIASKTAAPVT